MFQKFLMSVFNRESAVIGMAIAGMPAGSPGMEISEFESVPFDVVTFSDSGEIETYASCP